VQLEANAYSDTAIVKYVWNASDSLNFSGCADSTDCYDPVAHPSTTHIYYVTVVNARGCSVTDSVLVTVSNQPSIFIPSAFTPNDDGLNDVFEFDILGAKSGDMEIWDRWGARVFSNPNQPNGVTPPNGTSVSHGWDGKVGGKVVQYDTYTYQLTVTYFDGHQETMTGTVVVIR
jgi:gliding motility-associated-like protein